LFWHYQNNCGTTGPEIGLTSTIRKGDYKLIYYHLNSSFELFNITNDIGETFNLVLKNKLKTIALAKQLGKYLRSVNAQMPTSTETGKLVPWPDDEAILNNLN